MLRGRGGGRLTQSAGKALRFRLGQKSWHRPGFADRRPDGAAHRFARGRLARAGGPAECRRRSAATEPVGQGRAACQRGSGHSASADPPNPPQSRDQGASRARPAASCQSAHRRAGPLPPSASHPDLARVWVGSDRLLSRPVPPSGGRPSAVGGLPGPAAPHSSVVDARLQTARSAKEHPAQSHPAQSQADSHHQATQDKTTRAGCGPKFHQHRPQSPRSGNQTARLPRPDATVPLYVLYCPRARSVRPAGQGPGGAADIGPCGGPWRNGHAAGQDRLG